MRFALNAAKKRKWVTLIGTLGELENLKTIGLPPAPVLQNVPPEQSSEGD